MDNPIKRKRKKRWEVVQNEDGSYTKERTNFRGKIIRKKITPVGKQKSSPEKEPKEKEPRPSREQRKADVALMKKVDQDSPVFKTKEEKREAKQRSKEFDKQRKQKSKENRKVERQVIRAERQKGRKKNKVKLKGKKNAYTGGGSSGGGSKLASSCNPGQGGKCFDD